MPARTARRRAGIAAALLATALVIPLGARAASAQEVSPSPSPAPGDASQDSWHVRARVKPGPNATFGAPSKLGPAMGKAHDAACAQTRNLLAEGRPNRSRVRLNLIREAGDPDATAAYAPGGGCAVVEQRTSAFKLRAKASFPLATGGRTTTGRRRLSKALAVLAQRVNALRDEVLSTGEVGEFRLILIPVPKRVQGMIRGLARRHTLSVAKSLSVAKCESNFNPHAYNPAGPWAGVYQQDTDYWPGRAKRFGHPGESVFDPYANIDVSLKMARGVGWGHWACG